MSMTPIGAGSNVTIQLIDENDPESPVVALYYDVNTDEYHELGNSFGADLEYFAWMVKSFAQFHNLPIVDPTGKVKPNG